MAARWPKIKNSKIGKSHFVEITLENVCAKLQRTPVKTEGGDSFFVARVQKRAKRAYFPIQNFSKNSKKSKNAKIKNPKKPFYGQTYREHLCKFSKNSDEN